MLVAITDCMGSSQEPWGCCIYVQLPLCWCVADPCIFKTLGVIMAAVEVIGALCGIALQEMLRVVPISLLCI